MTVLDPLNADRLAKICGLFSSNHDGERAAAAAKADEIVRKLGLTWPQVVGAETRTPARTAPRRTSRAPRQRRQPLDGDIAYALRCGVGILNKWETDFLRGLGTYYYLSEKQRAILAEIFVKVHDARRAAA